MPPELSIIIPALNESESNPTLFNEVRQALESRTYEIIFIDDGSTDGSADMIEQLAMEYPFITGILFAKNYGQTAALAAAFKEARGEIIVPLDADGQNDPRDIIRLVDKLTEGFDVVSGWRHPRRDPLLSRRIPSVLANAVIARITQVSLHDFGCTLKAYRASVLEGLRLYGEMHRFLPAWCAWRGARIAEIHVNHRPRTTGKSKYGVGRTFKVLLDLLTTRFINGYLSKPSYLFGGVGFLLYFLSFICTCIVFYDKFGPNRWPPFRIPIMLLASFLGIIATLLLMLGLLAELIVRVYYEVAGESSYRIRSIVKQLPNGK
jgi:glycosyltransferase involved in cell wall biosynthesis